MVQQAIASVLLVVWFILGNTAGDPETQAKTDRARTILHLLIDGKYEEFAATGTEQVKAKMDAKMAEQVWTGFTGQFGPYKSEVSATVKKVQNVWAVSFVSRFEHGKATMIVSVDDAERMAGFFITAPERDVPYKAPDYVDAGSYREEKVTVSAGEFPLPGTVSLPKSAGKHPGVVLVHGSGPHDEDETVGANKPFRDLAGGLASQGIVVLRYEKRTHKHPLAVKQDEWTLQNETIEDALAGAELLRKRPEVDAKRVFVVGHSLGAFAAPFIGEQDAKLGGIVLMAGNARPILDVIDDQMDYLGGLDPTHSEEAKKKVQETKEATAKVRAGQTVGLKVLEVPAVYWARINKMKPVQAAAKLKMPILILQGGRDYQVTGKDFAIWKKELSTPAHKNVTLKLFENLNHLFMAGEGKATPAEYEKAGHVDREVITTITEWIKKN